MHSFTIGALNLRKARAFWESREGENLHVIEAKAREKKIECADYLAENIKEGILRSGGGENMHAIMCVIL